MIRTWAVCGLVLVAGACRPSTERPPPPAPDVVRGVALGLFATDPRYDYTALVAEIADRGARDVLVVVPWYQTDLGSHDIGPQLGASPADDTVVATLKAVTARGMRPSLLPLVRLERRTPSAWRGVIRPTAGPVRWFSSYTPFVERMADLATRGGAVRLYVGSEFASLEHHDAAWRAIVAAARRRFGGIVTYSANWDRFDAVPFWDVVDEIGVTGYFPLAVASGLPALDALEQAWSAPRAAIARLAARTGKPVVFTEVGYASRPSAAVRPWDDGGPAEPDPQLQARLYDGFCRAWIGRGVVRGFFAWNWFGIGGPRDAGFTPRGKPAAAVLGSCLRDQRR